MSKAKKINKSCYKNW